MATINYLVANILQNIFYGVQQKKEIYFGKMLLTNLFWFPLISIFCPYNEHQWLPTFFKMSSLIFCRTKKVIQMNVNIEEGR